MSPSLADLRKAKDDLLFGRGVELGALEAVIRAEALLEEMTAAHKDAKDEELRATHWGNVQAARQALKNAQQTVKDAQHLQADAIKRGAELVAD